MRAVLFRSLLVIGAGAIVLAAVLYVASTVDARPPEVLDVSLTQPVADDADLAHITTSIEVSFSEPVDPQSVEGAVTLDPAVDGTASVSGSTLIFTPGEPLEISTEYAVSVEPGIRDLSGNVMTEAPPPFSFTTAGRPALASADPADGATDVAVDTTIELVFSSLMDTASVEEALEIEPGVPHELRWSGERLEILPAAPLEPGTTYRIRIGDGAADVAGVSLGSPATVEFRTVAPGLQVEAVVPADGADGISPRASIAVVFDRAVDPGSVDAGLLTISPEVAGTLEVVPAAGDADGGRMLRFAPSAPLPPNTTFEVQLAPELVGVDGGRLAEGLSWSFTTGAPQATLSNQVLFLSDRGGVTNVWAMNPDGTGQRQVTAELQPVVDYAVAPNGSSLVVADGRRLVYLRADGSERQVLTDDAHLEFDPAYAPDGFHVAFGRADAATGQGLGLWRWEIASGTSTEIELPVARPSPSPAPGDPLTALRAPRYSPDTGALAFVDLTGQLGILERPGQRLTLVDADVAAVPAWDAQSSAILLRIRPAGEAPDATLSAPVARLEPGEAVDAGVVRRSGTTLLDAGIEDEVLAFVGAPDGRIGWIDADGMLHIAPGLDEPGDVPEPLEEVRVSELAFGPTEGILVVVIGEPGAPGVVERVDLESGERTELTSEGWLVRWLP